MALRVAVLIKQVPRVEEMRLGADGRLRRDGVELEMNAYCRRAVSKGVEVAHASGGRCSVITLGPPAAEDALREAVAWGADEGVLVTDPAFAGSDTLATARAVSRALEKLGPFDVVFTGRNSIDADTGQVGPAVAELLGLPFLGGVKVLEISGDVVRATCEHDDRTIEARLTLPAVLSCAERLCEPAKVPPEGRAAVPADRIRRLSAADLGAGPWGQAGSPTSVGATRTQASDRRGTRCGGSLAEQVDEAISRLQAAGVVPVDQLHRLPAEAASVPDGWPRGDASVVVLVEPGRPRVAWELLGAAARLAREIRGRAVAITLPGAEDPGAGGLAGLGRRGADEEIRLIGPTGEQDAAAAVAGWCEQRRPYAVLAPGTMWGREVAARTAARLGAGLVGDAIELSIADGRLVAWKPAFGGNVVAAITASSAVQLATVRPGVTGLVAAREPRAIPITEWPAEGGCRVEILSVEQEDDMDELVAAPCVIGVGRGVRPHDYPQLDPLRRVLGAELAATRKVTDQGWLPRARQVGITGRAIAPQLYVAVGMSGKFNHLVGVRQAGCILAINSDPAAPVFDHADLGIVGDWHEAVPLLAASLEALGSDAVTAPR